MAEATNVEQHSNLPAIHNDILEDEYSVVIAGAGPAGLALATCLAKMHVHTLVVDLREGPTIAGRADGVQPRTMEALRNVGNIGEQIIAQGSKCYERTFWQDEGEGLHRKQRVQSCPPHLETQDPYTLGCQQGSIELTFLREMENDGLLLTRPWRVEDFEIGDASTKVTLINEKSGQKKAVSAKYFVGCEGGRSVVRRRLEETGRLKMAGEWVDTLWGAIDAVVDTDFPDIRKIAAVHSKSSGAIMVFPREKLPNGDRLVRLYTQINKIPGEWSTLKGSEAARKVQVEDVMKADKAILRPFSLDFKEVQWWTAYPIGQRIANTYDIQGRVFIAGDACHTHSPKAGQGMNTAIMDSLNLAWKIGLVENGVASESLLKSYTAERQPVGRKLIDFDSEFSALFSGEVPKGNTEYAKLSDEEKSDYFFKVQRRNAEFTSGIGVAYSEGGIIGRDMAGCNLKPGHRLDPAFATRFINSEPVRLVHEVKYDAPGSFRIYVLTGDLSTNKTALQKLEQHLASSNSFFSKYKSRDSATKALPPTLDYLKPFINPLFALLTIVPENRFKFELSDLKGLPHLSPFVYADDCEPHGSPTNTPVGGAHKKWGFHDGGIVVVRPDGYIGICTKLDELSHLDNYFKDMFEAAGPKI